MLIFLIISSCEENKKKLQNDTIKIAEKELKTSTDTIHYSSSPKKIDFERDDQNEIVLIDGKNRCKFNHESISFEGFAKVQAGVLHL